jgi:hypothetical protein
MIRAAEIVRRNCGQVARHAGAFDNSPDHLGAEPDRSNSPGLVDGTKIGPDVTLPFRSTWTMLIPPRLVPEPVSATTARADGSIETSGSVCLNLTFRNVYPRRFRCEASSLAAV